MELKTVGENTSNDSLIRGTRDQGIGNWTTCVYSLGLRPIVTARATNKF